MEIRRAQSPNRYRNQEQRSTNRAHEHQPENSESLRRYHTRFGRPLPRSTSENDFNSSHPHPKASDQTGVHQRRLSRSASDSALNPSHPHPIDASRWEQPPHQDLQDLPQPHAQEGQPLASSSTELHEPSEPRMDHQPQSDQQVEQHDLHQIEQQPRRARQNPLQQVWQCLQPIWQYLQQSWEEHQRSVNIYSQFQDFSYPGMHAHLSMRNYRHIDETMYMTDLPYMNEQIYMNAIMYMTDYPYINRQHQTIIEQKNNAGHLLNLDLSKVSTDIYAKACSISIVAIEDRDSKGDNLNLEHTLMMEDILLRSGKSKNITSETRKSDQYKNLLKALREELPRAIREAQEQQNQDREPQNPT